jgi:hypothetical protein
MTQIEIEIEIESKIEIEISNNEWRFELSWVELSWVELDQNGNNETGMIIIRLISVQSDKIFNISSCSTINSENSKITKQ